MVKHTNILNCFIQIFENAYTRPELTWISNNLNENDNNNYQLTFIELYVTS